MRSDWPLRSPRLNPGRVLQQPSTEMETFFCKGADSFPPRHTRALYKYVCCFGVRNEFGGQSAFRVFFGVIQEGGIIRWYLCVSESRLRMAETTRKCLTNNAKYLIFHPVFVSTT